MNSTLGAEAHKSRLRFLCPARSLNRFAGRKVNNVKVSTWNYGNYSSDNYGSSRAVGVGSLTLYFSYRTVIAFSDGADFAICQNRWGPTTGKHLNWVNPDKSLRISGSEFLARLDAALERHSLV